MLRLANGEFRRICCYISKNAFGISGHAWSLLGASASSGDAHVTRASPTRELQQAIFAYVDYHNDTAKGSRWKALPEEILAKVRRARAVLDKTPTA